jgi:hypothetical protein
MTMFDWKCPTCLAIIQAGSLHNCYNTCGAKIQEALTTPTTSQVQPASVAEKTAEAASDAFFPGNQRAVPLVSQGQGNTSSP